MLKAPRYVFTKAASHGCRKTPRRAGQTYARVPLSGSIEPAPQSGETADPRAALESSAARPSRAFLHSSACGQNGFCEIKKREQPEFRRRRRALRLESAASAAESPAGTTG